ncbi:MAG: hypothetical protein ACOCZ8_02500 [Bacteroidota bacterium]
MNKYLILMAFAITGLMATACGEVCYECYDQSEGQVVNEFCATEEDEALEDAIAFEQSEEASGNPDVSCERN